MSNDELLRRHAEQVDAELQADPELAEGRAGSGRIALFAIALVAVLAVVFYGLNASNTSSNNAPVAQQTAPATPSGGNTPAGQTTGSAATPQNNPAPAAPQTNGAAQTNQ